MNSIWNGTPLKKFPSAITDISINYVLEILMMRKYNESNVYKDTLSIFAELLYRISEEEDLSEKLLYCFEEINKRNPIKDED